eukprot:gnl/TRDRNA2_/TRDRNA2_178087_c2_seq1.p1 gnl/TRDRNA2_/TRDRNA2_178087_c2~~gnl/TRDRNA2_/TRDRNA2_178087_c2_seq1.p1  ORF type:complete len:2167 (-),score=-96.49 gnl/TRDRNA2_/TRDRNA2_178087_c2_seq1:381-6881(-)
MAQNTIGAEQFARNKQFDYHSNSNLVLTSERSARGVTGPSGSPESLWGRIKTKMGDRSLVTKKKKMESEKKPRLEEEKPKKFSGYGDVTRAVDDLKMKLEKRFGNLIQSENSIYTPKTEQTKAAYEMLSAFVRSSVGDYPSDVLQSLTIQVLNVLKSSACGTHQKDKIEKILGKVEEDRFSHLLRITTIINDFFPDKEKKAADDVENKERSMNVAVEFEDENDSEELETDIVADTTIDDDTINKLDESVTRKNLDYILPSKVKDNVTLDLRDIDAYWLQRQIAEIYNHLMDASQSQQLSNEIFVVLSSCQDERDVERRLVMMLGFEKFEFIKTLVINRLKIVWCTRLCRAQNETEREDLKKQMKKSPETLAILNALLNPRTSFEEKQAALERSLAAETRKFRLEENISDDIIHVQADKEKSVGRINIDLGILSFSSFELLMSNKKCQLPNGSFRTIHKGYEEVYIPPPPERPSNSSEKLISKTELPYWTRAAFEGLDYLNVIQSKVCESALYSNNNILLCAPTGSGKTNVAILTMLHEIGMHFTPSGSLHLDSFKIVYLAPMKALVSEVVRNITQRLAFAKINVRELTGDANLTKEEIHHSQVIVATPEKWDIVTRKCRDRSYVNLVNLLILDEIHLLHDERGPVIESIIARTIRQIETSQKFTRIIGLSATLPNFEEIASFLKVKFDNGLFNFDNTYRPCPLKQRYIGVIAKKPVKRCQIIEDVCCEKVVERAGKCQIIVFVETRKMTTKTAFKLKKSEISGHLLGSFLQDHDKSREIIRQEATVTNDSELGELLLCGMGTHHAGMSKLDRTLVEDLFSDGNIQILVSTSTLAWGVNLPAHTVILKGTRVYNPAKGTWNELSMLDVMQMFGRAGRPQYDSFGEGIIITGHTELQFYLSLLNQQLPIESHYLNNLPDCLIPEVVLNNVSNIKEACSWLGYTYCYIRMLKNPNLYGVPNDSSNSDPFLKDYTLNLAHSAALKLSKNKLVEYNKDTGQIKATALGCIASNFYVKQTTIATYSEGLKPTMEEIDLLRLFSSSDEFKCIVVREEEKVELRSFVDRVPIPVREPIEEPKAKINILLQCFVSRIALEGFASQSDMIYITQTSGRLFRCLFEISFQNGWAELACKTLTLCKVVAWRMWSTQTPLRQFNGIPHDVISKIEKKDIYWEQYYDLKESELGELIQAPMLGKNLYRIIQIFPKLEITALILPIARDIIQLNLILTPNFNWDDRVHGTVEPFWITVEDTDSEKILNHEYFLLRPRLMNTNHTISFMVPISAPVPPHYYVRVISDKWLSCETSLVVGLGKMLLPDASCPVNELLDLYPLPISALKNDSFEKLYNDQFQEFNPLQTQVFSTLYNTNDNVLLAAPASSGKTISAELAILRMIATKNKNNNEETQYALSSKCAYVAPYESTCEKRYREWKAKFGGTLRLNVSKLTGKTTSDLQLLAHSHIVICTSEIWDALSRLWKQSKIIQQIKLFIIDKLHFIGADRGPEIETIVSRMRFINTQLDNQNCRVVALSVPLDHARDLANWCGAMPHSLFNFSLSARYIYLQIQIHGFNINDFESRLETMTKPIYNAILQSCCEIETKPVILFTPTKKSARQVSLDMLSYTASDGHPNRFLIREDLFNEKFIASEYLIQDPALKHSLRLGLGYLYETQQPQETEIVEELFNAGIIQVLIVTAGSCWKLSCTSYMSVIMDTQISENVDYQLIDLLEMMGKAGRALSDQHGLLLLMCKSSQKSLYKRFMFEPLALESRLNHKLHDIFNAEIVGETINGKQDAVDYLTWTFYYRRLFSNPNYYNITHISDWQISNHLSELVETTLDSLDKFGLIIIGEDNLSVKSANLGRIAAHYHVRYTTIEIYKTLLNNKIKQKEIIEVLSSSSEFENIVTRPDDKDVIRTILSYKTMPTETFKLYDPHVKTSALLHAHFLRVQVRGELFIEQRAILLTCMKLISAMVDIIATENSINPLLATMELSQMIVQGQYSSDSPLLQLPHVSKKFVDRYQKTRLIDSVYNVIDLDDADRKTLFKELSETQMADVANVCNRYPDIYVNAIVSRTDSSKNQFIVKVLLERSWDSNGPVPPVDAPLYPAEKKEEWWIIGFHAASKLILFMKKVALDIRAELKWKFLMPNTPHDTKFKLYLMCDSYIGCDQEHELSCSVESMS